MVNFFMNSQLRSEVSEICYEVEVMNHCKRSIYDAIENVATEFFRNEKNTTT